MAHMKFQEVLIVQEKQVRKVDNYWKLVQEKLVHKAGAIGLLRLKRVT